MRIVWRNNVAFDVVFLLLALIGSPGDALRLEAGQRIPSRISIPAIRLPITPAHDEKKPSIFDLPRVEEWATQHDLQERHLKTIYQVAMKTRPGEVDGLEFTNALKQADFPHKHAEDLSNTFELVTSRIVEQAPSASGGTKIVIQLASGKLVETVLIRHERSSNNSSPHGTNRNVRYTVCVSSQVGCAKACSFCATGTMGLLDHLSSAEILEQVYLARSILPSANSLRNLVFMGMGEPLDNYDAVHEACRGLTHQCLFGFKAKQVTISTVGDAPDRIRQLAQDAPQISLALSLHGATQALRATLIPTAKRAPLIDLEAALEYHASHGGRGIMLEYLLIDGLNDTAEAADALVEFCRRASYATFVNLIPYNPTIAGADFDYQTPSDERIDTFHNRLREQRVNSLVRWSSAKGRDTNGACGQLALSISGGDTK